MIVCGRLNQFLLLCAERGAVMVVVGMPVGVGGRGRRFGPRRRRFGGREAIGVRSETFLELINH